MSHCPQRVLTVFITLIEVSHTEGDYGTAADHRSQGRYRPFAERIRETGRHTDQDAYYRIYTNIEKNGLPAEIDFSGFPGSDQSPGSAVH